MIITKSCITDIKSLLENCNKIYLTKTYNNSSTRHVFYQTKDDNGNHFYHIRYTMSSDDNKIIDLRDFPVFNISPNNQSEVSKQIDIVTNKILDFVRRNGYTITCNREAS